MGGRYPSIRPFSDDERWLEQFTRKERPMPSLCCARCRRGTPALGVFPCGLEGACQCHA